MMCGKVGLGGEMKQNNAYWISRREFLRLSGLAGAALTFGTSRALLFPARAHAAELDFSPIAPVAGDFSSTDFNGDDIRHPHDLLWNIEPFIRSKGGRPTSAEEAEVVVVGGGIAGLLSAYQLRDRHPLVLEQAPRFGGNSKSESYRNGSYSIGAAYLAVPEPNDSTDTLLRELGLREHCKHESSEEIKVNMRGRGLFNLWNGDLNADSRAAFHEAVAALRDVYEHSFPSIPWVPGEGLSREQFQALDRETAEQWLGRKLPNLPVPLKEFFQLYCWSSFAGSLDELSAAQFLNFVSAETEGVLALPGGNGRVAAALVQKLQDAGASLSASSFVLEVAERNGAVEVLYEDAKGNLRLVRAKTAIVASPKYVARYIVKGLSRERDELWKNLPYRAYVVANVLLDQRVKSPAFDVYCLEGRVPASPRFSDRTDRAVTDFCFGGGAESDKGGASVLTFYRPLPFDGGRALVFNPLAHGRHRKEVLENISSILADLGLSQQVQGVRLTRWGHAIPLARPGFALDERIGASLGARIHFANQDNFMNPAFESSFAASQSAVAAARAVL
jgi:glycine/D-amino acid oxidase-like deaminating enzyme